MIYRTRNTELMSVDFQARFDTELWSYREGTRKGAQDIEGFLV